MYTRYSRSLPPKEEQPVPTWTAYIYRVLIYIQRLEFCIILSEHLRVRGYYKATKEGTIRAVPRIALCDLAFCIVFLYKPSQCYLKVTLLDLYKIDF